MPSHTADVRLAAPEVPERIPPYAFNGPFCYSLRCILCRHEVEHSYEQHLILTTGMRAVPR